MIMIFRQVHDVIYRAKKKRFIVISMLAIYTILNINSEKYSKTITKMPDESIYIKHSKKQTYLEKAKSPNITEESVFTTIDHPKRLKHRYDSTTVTSSSSSSPNNADSKTPNAMVKRLLQHENHRISESEYGNLTIDEINANYYSPVPGAGEHGRPVFMTPGELVTSRKLSAIHNYNLFVSDKISINRSLPDKRRASCKEKVYDISAISSASIIIIFHNEAWSTLMRTVMSVLLRSPQELIKEVLLVDDGSNRTYLRRELEEAVAGLDKVRIIRLPSQRGIVGARLAGARVAIATMLVFLDSHVEVTVGWLEPLLERAGNADVYVCPLLDVIRTDTFQYVRCNDSYWGGFTWRLDFHWFIPSNTVLKQVREDATIPFPTPAMAGGLFAVKKELFWRLGGYDEGMNIWGGENLELSWRAWQCGARVEIALCSRVGHLFRYINPIKYLEQTITINKARAAMVWMDDWSDFYFRFSKFASLVRDEKSVAERLILRKNMKCRSFKWYLDNVWPTHFFPTDTSWFGKIYNKNGCLGIPDDRQYSVVWKGISASLVSCSSDFDLNRLLIYTNNDQIINNFGLCLEHIKGRAVWKECAEKHTNQIWHEQGQKLVTSNGLCLTGVAKTTVRPVDVNVTITTKWCKRDDAQLWYFELVPWR